MVSWAAEDESTLSFHLSNNNNPLGVSMIVSDPFGRKAGINLVSGLRINNIPHASGGEDYVSNDETGEPIDSGSMYITIIDTVPVGVYSLELFGSTNTIYFLDISGYDALYNPLPDISFSGLISGGEVRKVALSYSSIPGAPAPVITKTVTLDALRQDLIVAQKLTQIGDNKFVGSLTRVVNLAERLADKCAKHDRHGKKCEPAIAVLNMFVKRLEAANRKCDGKNLKACDEDKDWNDFGKEHRKDHDYDDFFKDWDKDEWHKHKKDCKRFIGDEALRIISEDAQWLIKSLGGTINEHHDKEHKNNNDHDQQ